MSVWLNSEQCANYISMSAAWLQLQRSKKNRGDENTSPPFHRMGRAVRYDRDQVDKWLETRLVE